MNKIENRQITTTIKELQKAYKRAYQKGWRVGCKYGKMKRVNEWKKAMEIKNDWTKWPVYTTSGAAKSNKSTG